MTASKSQRKIPIYQSELFMEEITSIFKDKKRIRTKDQLMDTLTGCGNIPHKWTPNTVRKKLWEDGVLEYSRSKPRGYSLNWNKLLDLTVHELDVNQSQNLQSSSVQAKKLSKTKKPAKIKENTNQPQVQQSKSNALTSSSTSHSNTQKITSKSSQKFPQFLLERMPTKTQAIFQMSVLALEKKTYKTLDSYLEYLSSAKIFYDAEFENNRQIIHAINAKISYISELSYHKKEAVAEQKIQKIIVENFSNRRFQKVVSKLGEKYTYKEAAPRIMKKLRRKRKKIPLSDYALEKWIVNFLKEHFPDKS